MSPEELQQVRSVPLFAGIPDTKLSCLEPGVIIEAPAGTLLAEEGVRNGFFHVLLEGEVRITRNYERQSILMRVIKPGNFFGEIMFLLDITWLTTVRVTKPARLFQLNEEGFWRMMTECQTVAREIFSAAASRMRNVEGYTQQREKLVSLGTMAAGLAHELNNPAAAARRAATHLGEAADKAQSLLCKLSRIMDSDHWRHLLNAELQAIEKLPGAPVLDHLTRSDHVDALADWLNGRGVAAAWEIAPTFVTAGIDADWLGPIAEKLPPEAQAGALEWLEARLGLKLLVSQVAQSTERISELVKAIKSYSYMDQSPMQEIDIHEGIESTLTMLGHKLKSVKLIRAFDRSLPRIMAYGSELNQVWTNLIDNAADAVKGTGEICVGTSLDDNHIVVEIVDNGPGIPPQVQARMFEPFFTTKGVGAGTGLGLVMSNRIVGDRHGGEIEFESHPGRTQFKVRLPLNHQQPPAPSP